MPNDFSFRATWGSGSVPRVNPPTAICSVKSCQRLADGSRGFCHPHYMRYKRHGSPTAGETSRTELMRYLTEQVLTHTGDDCLFWPYCGYITVDGKKYKVHQFVCEQVHGSKPGPTYEVAHSCGKGHKLCCAPNHVRWATHAENENDKVRHGTSNRGERHGLAKLSTKQVEQIIALRGVKPRAYIAHKFAIDPTTVSRIQNGKRWAHIAMGG